MFWFQDLQRVKNCWTVKYKTTIQLPVFTNGIALILWADLGGLYLGKQSNIPEGKQNK